MTEYNDTTNDDISANLDFILSHFPEPIYPRTISTKNTTGRQIVVHGKKQTLATFRDSNFIDCRINVYPNYLDNAPNLIFIDLDRASFKTNLGLTRALNSTLNNIHDRLNANPTVLWSGNGYHVYQPLESFPLEEISDFNDIENPSTKFIRFAAKYLSNSKSDFNNNPSIKSCMLRMPGSINSKNNNLVRIVQKWDGTKPDFRLILGSFYAHVVGEKIIEKRRTVGKSCYNYNNNNNIQWIEYLLDTPVDDGRKFAVSLILVPYLVNVKKNSIQESYEKITKWLNKCSKLRSLDTDLKYRVKYALKQSLKSNYKPIMLNNVKSMNIGLYNLVKGEIRS